tara:strand:- start:608 stop:1321 length:714 start_codon:yes stop_codon:yes gene_type:complete
VEDLLLLAELGKPLHDILKEVLSIVHLEDTSVYEARGPGHKSLGYRLGVVAVSARLNQFKAEKTNVKAAHRIRRGATVSLLRSTLDEHGCDVRVTPDGCDTYTPAAPFHLDIIHGKEGTQTLDELLDALQTTFHQGDVEAIGIDLKLDGREPVTFSELATTVLEYVAVYYKLEPESPWEDRPNGGEDISSQIGYTKRLAKVFGIDLNEVDTSKVIEQHKAELAGRTGIPDPSSAPHE